MADPKRLETPENLETRAYYKRKHLKKRKAGQSDVILAATEIYQTEFGHWFEDEGYDGLWEEADALYRKHSLKVTDPAALVDLIVTGLHGDCLTAFEIADGVVLNGPAQAVGHC